MACFLSDSGLFSQTLEFIIMADRACLLPIMILLTVLLFADISIMCGLAHVMSRNPNDNSNTHEDSLLVYGFVILPLIAFGIIIVIAMITLPLLTRPVNRIQTLSLKRPRWTLRQRHDRDRDGQF